MLRLVPAEGRAFKITPEDSGKVIGRSAEADYLLEDGSVSRKHARLEMRGQSWFVVDLGSANGTFVGGVRIGESEIAIGQELRIGSVSMKVEPFDSGAPDATVAISGMTAIFDDLDLVAQGPAPPTVQNEPPPEISFSAVSPPAPPRPPSVTPAARIVADAPVAQMSAPPPARKGRSPWLWVGAGCGGCLTLILVFMALVGGGLYVATRGPVDAAKAQLALISSGEIGQAYGQCSEGFRTQTSRAEFEAMVAAHPALKSFADSTFSNVSRQNSVARLGGTIESTTGGTEPIEIELVQENDEWRIHRIHFP
jgi:hypothetical protein